jgi:hypothetical protein
VRTEPNRGLKPPRPACQLWYMLSRYVSAADGEAIVMSAFACAPRQLACPSNPPHARPRWQHHVPARARRPLPPRSAVVIAFTFTMFWDIPLHASPKASCPSLSPPPPPPHALVPAWVAVAALGLALVLPLAVFSYPTTPISTRARVSRATARADARAGPRLERSRTSPARAARSSSTCARCSRAVTHPTALTR